MISRKHYKIQTWLQWRTNRKSYSLSKGASISDLESHSIC